jgi:hypothetical protein
MCRTQHVAGLVRRIPASTAILRPEVVACYDRASSNVDPRVVRDSTGQDLTVDSSGRLSAY